MQQFDRSVDNLLGIIKKQKQDISRLADLVVYLTREDGVMTTNCDVISSGSELIYYLDEYDADYIVFITPGQLVVCMDREEIDRLTEVGELVGVIARNWEDGTIAIPVP